MVGLLFLCSFLIVAEIVTYFSVFSPKQSHLPLYSFNTSSIIKCLSYVDPLLNTTGISLGILYFKLKLV